MQNAGAGIKIGIIDTGIDVNHPAFRDPLPPVDGFPKVLAAGDTKYTNSKIIVAKNYTGLLSFGGERDVIGKTVYLNKLPFTVVGVLPKEFRGQSGNAEFWAPLMMAEGVFFANAKKEYPEAAALLRAAARRVAER